MKTNNNDPCNEGMEIVAYLAGVMPLEDRPRFEEHLAQCDACRERLVVLHRMGGDIPESVEPVKLNKAWRRVEQALEQWHGTTPDSDEGATDPPQPAPPLAHVIHLRPRIHKPARPHDAAALAAATVQAAPLSSITYASDDSAVIGKLAREERSGDLLLYLIAENLSAIAGSHVTARDEETGSLAEGTPDDYGVVPLPATSGWNPTKMRVEVHLPG